MTIKLTQLMAAAAVVATCLSGQAMAAPVTTAAGDIAYVSGTPFLLDPNSRSSLAYSTDPFDGQDVNTLGGAVGAFGVGRVQVRDINGAGTEETYTNDEFGDAVLTGITPSLYVSSHTIDDTTGQILSVGTAGSIEHRGTRISGTLTGGVATATNLRFDLANSLVYADLAGTKAAVGTSPALSYNLPNTALWNIGAISGPTVIDPAVLALTGQARIDALIDRGFTDEGNGFFSAQIVLSRLLITTPGFDFFKQSLGLLSTGVGAFGAVNGDRFNGWGSVNLKLNFSVPAVPEPGSYALAGAGLLVVWGAARRARRLRGA